MRHSKSFTASQTTATTTRNNSRWSKKESFFITPSPVKANKESTLSNPRKEEHQSYYHQKSKRKSPIQVKKLSTCFNIKNQSKFEHQHDVVYYVDCPNEKCRENYIDKSCRRISKLIKDHNDRDLKSHILRHFVESGHVNVSYEDFKIIAKNLNFNHWKRKIAESLLIKEKRPTLNTHDKSVPLKLFN